MPGLPLGFGMPAWCGGRGQGPEDLGEEREWNGVAGESGTYQKWGCFGSGSFREDDS